MENEIGKCLLEGGKGMRATVGLAVFAFSRKEVVPKLLNTVVFRDPESVPMAGRLLDVIGPGACLGAMASITGGPPRQTSMASPTGEVLARFQEEAMDRMSASRQRGVTLALVRNPLDRLVLPDPGML